MSDDKINLRSIISAVSDNIQDQDLSWSGTMADYLNKIKEDPKITRNAYQRLFDLIIEHGTKKYIDVKKEVIHYNFFDDEVNGG